MKMVVTTPHQRASNLRIIITACMLLVVKPFLKDRQWEMSAILCKEGNMKCKQHGN